MIVFYNTSKGLCVRSANGIAANVTITGGKAYYGTDILLENMTNITYADVPDQDILYFRNNVLVYKAFSSLKTGIPNEVRLTNLESAQVLAATDLQALANKTGTVIATKTKVAIIKAPEM